jgi:L-threonine-O-3-phosphate decarboxylase
MLEHGGRLARAAQEYGIPLDKWVDLSTGIHPVGYPVPPVPPECWRRLPEEEDGLLPVAAAYYGASHLIPCAGSQAAIQALPMLRPPCRVGILAPTYAEHAHAWQQAGHTVQEIQEYQPEMKLDVLLVVNPNNPTGRLIAPDTLLEWHAELAAKGGWLVVDEAFMDATPEHSLARHAGLPGLVILRSLGKFFGLAGIRAGFVLAWPALLNELREKLGPWSVPAPTRWVAQQALADTQWQASNRIWLAGQSQQLAELLARHGLTPNGGTALFQWVCTPDAQTIHQRLAQLGILTRLFHQPSSLRFGLPENERGWVKLDYLLTP